MVFVKKHLMVGILLKIGKTIWKCSSGRGFLAFLHPWRQGKLPLEGGYPADIRPPDCRFRPLDGTHFGPRDRYPADGCEPDREFWNNGLKFKKEMKECKKSDSNIDKYGNNIHNLQALKRKSRRIFLKSWNFHFSHFFTEAFFYFVKLIWVLKLLLIHHEMQSGNINIIKIN